MHKLPITSGMTVIKTFEKMGFKKVRQRGSHGVLRKDNDVQGLVVQEDYSRNNRNSKRCSQKITGTTGR